MDGLLGLDQKVIDLVVDLVDLPYNGRRGIDNDLAAGWALLGGVFLLTQ